MKPTKMFNINNNNNYNSNNNNNNISNSSSNSISSFLSQIPSRCPGPPQERPEDHKLHPSTPSYQSLRSEILNRHQSPVRVYFDITISNTPIGRIVIDLFFDKAPLTCENFLQLCTHQQGFGYRNTPIFHVDASTRTCIGGDITQGMGSGGFSIYGDKFPCEGGSGKHDGQGVVSMINILSRGFVNSQFGIFMEPRPDFDGYHCAFGKVAPESLPVVEQIIKQPRSGLFGWVPRDRIFFVDCGILTGLGEEIGVNAGIRSLGPASMTSVSERPAQVFLDVALKNEPLGRIVINLCHDIAPCTCALFVSLATHAHARGFGYKGTRFTSIDSENGYCIGGGLTDTKASGGVGLYCDKLICENFTRKHDEKGLVSMVDLYKGGYVESAFAIQMKPRPQADGVNIVFGKVTEESYPVVDVILQQKGGGLFGMTLSDAVIFNCGVLWKIGLGT